MKAIDLTGLKFGRWKVIEFSSSRRSNKNSPPIIYYRCKCECGVIKDVCGSSLREGLSLSCGCLRSEDTKRRCRTGSKNIMGKYWGHIRTGAKVRNLEFSIDIDFAQDLLEKQEFKCALSGIKLIMDNENSYKLKGEYGLNTGSLDRIDSSKGYTKDNVQWIHKDINKMKNNIGQKIFIDFCIKIAENIKNINTDSTIIGNE